MLESFVPRAEASAAHAAPFFDVLYAEDFDDPADLAGLTAEVVEPPPPAITAADVTAACDAAVRSARLDWQAAQEQARLNVLLSLKTLLAGMGETVERTTLSTAEGTVTTILAMIAGLLPHFAREHGPAEVRALLERLLPTIHSQDRITIRVHPDLVSPVQRDIDGLDAGLSDKVDVVAAPLERGDVKVAWENGSMTRDSRQIAQAIGDALSQLGLQQPIEAPAKRRMAYAD